MGDSVNWYLYFIIFFLLFIIPAIRQTDFIRQKRIRKRREMCPVTNEILKRFIGKKCSIVSYNSSFGEVGVIEDVSENWIVVTANNGAQKVVNSDYVMSVTEVVDKKKKKD